MKRSAIIFLFLILLSCTYRDIPRAINCAETDLALLESTKSAPSGCNSTDGVIIVTATGGKQPYSYSINGSAFQSNGNYNNLGSGNYSIVVKDGNLCERTLLVTLPSVNSTLDGSAKVISNTGCSTPNGSITITAVAGFSPYQYQLNTNGFGNSAIFSGLASGTYTVTIKDSKGCIKVISATVDTGATTVSYANDIAPILTTYCNLSGCHGAGTGRDWTTYTNVKANSANIKTRTSNKSMPPAGSPALTQAQIDLIGCWVTGGSPNN